jgi:hypothetical protein
MKQVQIKYLGLLFIFCCSVSAFAGDAALRIFAWRADTASRLRLPSVIPMIWVPASYVLAGISPPRGVAPETAIPARLAAREAAKSIKLKEPTHRAVLLYGVGQASGWLGEPPIFPANDLNIEAYARGGFTTFTQQWSAEFWKSLAEFQAEPDFIVLDYEEGGGYWGLRVDSKRRSLTQGVPEWATSQIAALEQLQAKMGALPGNYRPIDFLDAKQNWLYNHDAIDAFNEWTGARRTQALRASIVQPAWTAFQKEMAVSNFGEQLRAWPGVDSNGWVAPPTGAITGNWSSPCTYLGTAGQRYSVSFASKSAQYRRAVSWLDRRNDVRAALAVSKDVAPWYSNPDYGRDAGEDIASHRLLWAAGLLHDRAFGVDVMLFWSDGAWSGDEISFARPVLARLQSMSATRPGEIEKLDVTQAEDALSKWMELAAQLSRP